MEEDDGWAITRLDEMDTPPRASLDVSVADRCVGEDPLVDLAHFIRVSDSLLAELIGVRPNRHLVPPPSSFRLE